jgi:hypothetical protein
MKVILLIDLIGLLSILTSSSDISSKPASSPNTEHGMKHRQAFTVESTLDAIAYLDKFGYNACNCRLQCMDGGKNTSCPPNMESMLKTFQTFYHLPVTKKLDPKTLKLMNTARCGIEDKLFSSNKNQERG